MKRIQWSSLIMTVALLMGTGIANAVMFFDSGPSIESTLKIPYFDAKGVRVDLTFSIAYDRNTKLGPILEAIGKTREKLDSAHREGWAKDTSEGLKRLATILVQKKSFGVLSQSRNIADYKALVKSQNAENKRLSDIADRLKVLANQLIYKRKPAPGPIRWVLKGGYHGGTAVRIFPY